MPAAVVLDSSAILAVLNVEPGRERVVGLISMAAVSSVNMAEVAAKLIQQGSTPAEAEVTVRNMPCQVIAFDLTRALATGALHLQGKPAGLSLGDRACLALAKELGVPAITADRGWKKIAQDFEIQFIR